MTLRIQKFDINIFSGERPLAYGFIGCDTGRHCFDDILPRMPINNWVIMAEQPKLYNIAPIIASSNISDDVISNCMLRTGPLENIRESEIVGLIIEQNTKYKYNKSISGLSMNNASYRISIIFVINSQFLHLPPSIRVNLDYVFIAKETCINDRRSVYKYYAGVLPTFELFCSIVDVLCNSDFNFIVINNTCNTNDIDKNIFYY
jgi:hypothetical protein